MLDRARALVISELAEASKTVSAKVEKEVDEAMSDVLKPSTTH